MLLKLALELTLEKNLVSLYHFTQALICAWLTRLIPLTNSY